MEVVYTENIYIYIYIFFFQGFLILFLRVLTLEKSQICYSVYICKVVIYNYVFVGFYFVPNLIVILFNLMYPVFYLGFICKGCVRERERECVCEDSRQLKTKAVFTGSSRVSFLQSEACALHMTGMQRVKTRWRQLVFVSVSRVRPSREIPAKHSVLLNYHF